LLAKKAPVMRMSGKESMILEGIFSLTGFHSASKLIDG
jgi:hypothetical protein